MDEESPLQRLKRLEAEKMAGREAPPGTNPAPGGKKRGPLTAAAIAVLVFTFSKGKFLILFLATKGKLLFGALKLGPLLTTFTTMAVAAWAYANFFGVHFAVGFVLLVLVHELGHGLAAKIMKLNVSYPIFIPFFGALIAMKEQPRSTWIEAVVGFGGPCAGTLGGLAVLATGLALEEGFARGLLLALAWITFLMNFWNLMPIFGLDGDRISQPFRPWYWLPGCGVIVGLIWLCVEIDGSVNPFVVFILILGAAKGGRLWWRERKRAQGEPERLVDRVTEKGKGERYAEESSVEPWQRRAAAWAYFGLCVILCLLMLYAEQVRTKIE